MMISVRFCMRLPDKVSSCTGSGDTLESAVSAAVNDADPTEFRQTMIFSVDHLCIGNRRLCEHDIHVKMMNLTERQDSNAMVEVVHDYQTFHDIVPRALRLLYCARGH